MRAEGRLAFGQRVTGIIRRCADIVPRSAMREVAVLARGTAEGWAQTRVPPVVR
jgi:hypothetical protein